MNKRLEYLIAGLLIAAGLVHFSLYVQFMATSSLWIDEMVSIIDSSSRGVWVSWLNYSSNNHSFFNVLQAILNWQEPFDPLSARMISIIACSLIFPLVLFMCWSRGWVIEGGVVLLIVASNATLLDWVLQGRGYGIQLLCATLLCYGLLAYYDGKQRSGLIVMLVSVVLGTWVIPSFILFGGPVLLGLWLVERSTACFRTGAFALALILGYYLPSFGLIAAEASSYSEEHGRYFDSITAVADSVHQWVLPLPDAAIAVLAIAFIALPFLPLLPPDLRAASRILVPSVCLFFILCLLLGTPPTRVTLFVAVPVVLLLTVAVFSLLGQDNIQRRLIAGLVILVAALFVWPEWRSLTSVPKVPFENWMETGAVLNNAFPDDVDVAVSFRGNLLDPYLGPAVRRIDFDEQDSAYAVIDSNFLLETELRLADIPKRDYAVIVPQRRGHFIGILAHYPKQPCIATIHAAPGPENVAPLLDRSPHTAWHLPKNEAALLHLSLDSPHGIKALNWTQADFHPVNTVVWLDGEELPANKIRRYGNFMTVDLQGQTAQEIQIALLPLADDLSITQMWIVHHE